MNVLLDTNVLLRRLEPAHPQHPLVSGAMAKLAAGGVNFCLVSQTLYELWVVMTRPVAVNGLGKSVADASTVLNGLAATYTVSDDNSVVRVVWQQLVTTHAVLGKNAHDARLVAAMTVHNLTHLLTFNAADFQRFPTITVLTPSAVLAVP